MATPTGIVPELQACGLKGLRVVPIRDADKLAEAVIQHYLSLNNENVSQIATENRNLIENEFSIPAWTDKTIVVFKKAIEEYRIKREKNQTATRTFAAINVCV